MELLLNYDKAKEFYSLAKKTFMLIEHFNTVKNCGMYKIVENGKMTGLFVKDSKLFFLYENRKIKIEDSYVASLLNNSDNNLEKKFELLDSKDVILEFTYKLEENISAISPFEYLDDDEFDWGLFLSELINNKSKKENFIAIKMNNLFSLNNGQNY